MSFDLSQVMQTAADAVKGTSSSDRNLPPIIYPGDGILTVRLLFNPKSNNVMRLIHRHKLDTGKVDCASQWGLECPVCKAIETIRNTKGLDLWTLKSKTMGIAYAQYVGVSTGYDFGNRTDIPQIGDVILLMFPWSVYKQISELIQKAGAQASTLLTENAGRVITIDRKVDPGTKQVTYRVDVNAFTDPFQSKGSQIEFESFLESLPDLNESIMARECPENHMSKLQAEADALLIKYTGAGVGYAPTSPQYQAPSVQVQQPQEAPSSVSDTQVETTQAQNQEFVQQPQESTSVTSQNNVVAPVSSNEMPECFGKVNLADKKCLICPHTIMCSKKSKENG